MKRKRKTPPRRLRQLQSRSKPAGAMVRPALRESKPFDLVEAKLSLTFDALLDAIDTYREMNS